MNKINFYLLNQKGFSVIKEFIDIYTSKNIEYVVIGTDKNITNDYSKEIEEICKKNNIKYYFRNDYIPNNNNFTFVIGWRWIIKECKNLIVLHDSILPRYRGFAPLVNSLINGEDYLGVTALFASEEYDKGDIILQKSIKIKYPLKIREAIKKVSSLYEEIVIEISKSILSGEKIEAKQQDEKIATYSLWRDKEDYYINWENESTVINRFIDAVGEPYEGAKCFMDGVEIIIDNATTINDLNIENRDIGKVIFFDKGKPVIVCKKGLLRIDEARYTKTSETIFPLKKFRIRFR